MKLLISGICGFAGSNLAHGLLDQEKGIEIIGFDNFSRAGSRLNLEPLRKRGVEIREADARSMSDLHKLPRVDWLIDAAANPSVLAGVDGATSSQTLVENNLYGTVNLLELAKRDRAGFILLSTSRVYSIAPLANLPVVAQKDAFEPAPNAVLPKGLSRNGVSEDFSTAAPVSLYGASKLASETLALEYGETFDFPVWINRCGVLAGGGQFGKSDQGIFSFWINAYLRRVPLKYIGFDGAGHQTRDCLHPGDLVSILQKQMAETKSTKPRIVNFGGGTDHSMSLAQLSQWCAERFGAHEIAGDLAPRPFDVPWLVMDSRLAGETWGWQPATTLDEILQEIAIHAQNHPDWLKISGAI
jgi:CDP-paratose 2-epimerase